MTYAILFYIFLLIFLKKSLTRKSINKCAALVHQYHQYVQINFRDELLNKNIYVEDIELINRWSNEFKNYKSPSGNIDLDYEFLDQDIELDAMTFTYYLTLKLFNLILYIPKYIEERFYNRLEKFEKIYG